MHHLVERRGDQPRQTDHVRLPRPRGVENRLRGDHHAEVDHFVVVAAQHDADDVLTDIVHVPFDGGQDDGAVAPHASGSLLLRLEKRHQVSHGLLHDAGALHHLGQEHFPRTEQIADDVHPLHQGTLDHVDRTRGATPRLLDVRLDVVENSLDQRVLEPLGDRQAAPGGVCFRRGGATAEPLGQRGEPLRGVGSPVEQHVLDRHEQVGRDVFVHGELARIDDPHRHPRPDGMIEEGRVHRLADLGAAAEREREVAHAAAHEGVRQGLLDAAHRIEVGDRVSVVLFDPGRDREDVGVEDDVLGPKPRLLDEQAVGPGADRHFAIRRVRLALLVERHHDHGGAVAADQAGFGEELRLALLQADRVDDALALEVLEPRFQRLPARRVHHDGDLGDIGLGRHQAEKALHRGPGVEHPLVHVDVDDLRAARHLLARHLEPRLVVAGLDEGGEARRSGDVGPLPDVHEQRLGPQVQRLQARQPAQPPDRGNGAGR